jgi:ADP-heptose:LPS heptosyltransferase
MVVIRLSALGDVVLTTGVLDHWHRTRGLSFRVITRPVFGPLFENHPAVGETVAVAEHQLDGMRWLGSAWRIARRFSGYMLVDLHGALRSTILALLWQGPVVRYPKFTSERRRYLKHRSRNAQARLLASNVPQRYAMALDNPPPSPEEVIPRVFLTDDERSRVAAMLLRRGVRRPFVVLHPYAVHRTKQWPDTRWVELAALLDENGWDWIVVGWSENRFMKRLAGVRDLTATTDLRTTCGVRAHATVLVSGDSGPIHLAAAVGTPVVALFGPTSREWGFYPTGPKDRVIERPLACRPCSLHGSHTCDQEEECLRSIEPEEVLQEILEASS